MNLKLSPVIALREQVKKKLALHSRDAATRDSDGAYYITSIHH
jgi:hypothetical protein